MNPQIILLDEPLSSLDPIAAGEVMDVLRKLKKEKTLIMVTHKLEAVAELADRVVFLDQGQVCEDGTYEEVINTPKQEATKRFITYIKNLHYRIESPDFDRPELNARIEQYCNRFGLGTQAVHFTQLAIEEALNIIPLENGAKLILSKSEQEVRMMLDIIVPDSGVSLLDDEKCMDELSLSLIKGLCDVIEDRVENNYRILHLELAKESLLN
jgi:ABC-type glutathione transport system ATPase component